MTSPYRDAAEQYWEAGWPGPLPLPRRAKKDPPAGFTGWDGVYPSRADVQAWMDNGHAGSNIALRLPDDVIGIDVDMYDGKRGRVTLAELETKWGELPPTWWSTSRNDGSGIRFYRVPAGRRWPSVPGPGVEIIQHGHRYAVVYPSIHPSGQPYRWMIGDEYTEAIPDPRLLTKLPATWVEGLTSYVGPDRATGWTDPDLDRLVEHGTPAGANQDETLRDVVWKLRALPLAREASRTIWQTIVTRSTLTRPGEPWTARDFDRHWTGADKKIEDPPPVTTISEPPPKTGLRVFTRDQLADLPEPEPLITDTIDRRAVAVIAGAPGSLKSFTLQGWAASIATGIVWLGRVTVQGRVLLVAAEGAYGIHHRLTAWEDAYQTIPDDMLTVVAGPVNLLDPRQVAELCALAAGYLFIGIDTLARCMVGGDENSAKDMGQAVDSLYRIRDVTDGGCVAVAHHTPKSGGDQPRGSTALLGGVDTVYMADGGPQSMALKRIKRKDGPTDDVLSLRLELRLKSGLLALDKTASLTNSADTLLSTFLSTFKHTGASRAELRLVSEMLPGPFHRSLNSLLLLGILVNEGTDKRPLYKLGSGYRP